MANSPFWPADLDVRRVVVVGQGYVGLPLAMASVAAGDAVVGYDVDETRIQALQSGVSFVEDVPDTEVADALYSGRYTATSNAAACAGFDIAVITVPTPLREGTPDLSYIEEAGRVLGRFARPGCTIVLESTTYPGTTEELLGPIIEEASGLTIGEHVHLGYSPERIDPGNAVWTFRTTPKVVSGVDEESLAQISRFYKSIVDEVVEVPGPKEAELAKLLENTFRHVNIALVNEMAMFANDLGIDIWSAIDAASTKPFGYMRFTPGPGVGGHCLPIDPSYLAWAVARRLGHTFRFVELANDVNSHMPQHVVVRIAALLNEHRRAVNGSRVLVVGLAYKKNSSDLREAPALEVVRHLLAQGAEVVAADPHVREMRGLPADVALVELDAAEVERADAVVVLTDHDRFDLRVVSESSTPVLDTRHCVSGDAVHHL